MNQLRRAGVMRCSLARDGDIYVVAVGLEEHDSACLTTGTSSAVVYPSVAAGLTLGANSRAHTGPVNVSRPPRRHLL
jgi:hypothetical protein